MSNIYSAIVAVVTDYLGPAGERFVNRQVEFHLKKKPEEVTKDDIPKLAEWLKVTLAMLTEDASLVDDCSKRINGIVQT